jgi:hypothetical protein
MHQQINMRAAYARLGGDESTQHAYEAECERFRSSMRVPYAIAPRQRLLGRNGWLEAGSEVRPEDVLGRDDPHGYTPPHVVLRSLISKGVVLEASDLPAPPPHGT